MRGEATARTGSQLGSLKNKGWVGRTAYYKLIRCRAYTNDSTDHSWIVFSELLGFCFYFSPYFFVYGWAVR